MTQDIEKALAYQVKREMAERYFGMRRLIERDIGNLRTMIKELDDIYRQKIGPALTRIYSLLMGEEFINEFLQLCGWKVKPFWELYIRESEKMKIQALKAVKSHGWLKSSRFSNLLVDSYRVLYDSYLAFNGVREEVLDEIAVVQEEISRFSHNYSLDEIMSFLRGLSPEDESAVSVFGKNIDSSKMGELEERLAFEDVSVLEDEIPSLPRLPEPEEIEDRIKDMAHRVYERYKDDISRLVEGL